MTTDYRRGAQTQPRTEQRPRQGSPTRHGLARLLCAIVLAVLVVLSATGCGRHFQVTFHAGHQTGSLVTSKSGR